MKKKLGFIVLVTGLFFLLNSYQPKKKEVSAPEGTGRWTGTITMQVNYSGITGISERHISVSFIDALPTLNQNIETTNFNFTDDKGTGSVTYHAEMIIEGKKIGKTDCEGSGKSELHEVVIDETENTYNIHAIGPACNGTSVSLIDDKTEPYGPEFTDIDISDHPLGTSMDLLAGTKSETLDIPGAAGTVTTTITWHLERTRTTDELLIIPQNYDDWLPEPGRNELTKGSVMNISLKVVGRNGQPPTLKAKSFEVKLNNTSREPGITLNYPLITSNRNSPDIGILAQTNISVGGEFQTAEIDCNNGVSGNLSVAAFDGGGYTTLTAVAIMEDNSRLEGHLLISGGNTEVPIPKRSPGTKIGVAWLTANNNPGETDDKETNAGNVNDGDGLSAYEEYRGVISEGQFHRLDPNKKEVGVKMKRTEITLFSDGLAKFENASGLKVIRFGENEIGTDRKLNKNFLSAHIYDQYALFLQKGTLTGDLGKSFGGPAIPTLVSKTVIDQNRIRLSYQDRLAEARSINQTLSYSEKDLFETVTAHELSHSVSVKHHGSLAPNSLNLQIQPGKSVRIFDYNGSEILTRPYHITGRGGDIGNEQSGDVNCFILNNALCDWAVRTTPDSMFFYQVPLIPLGTKLCNNKDGTGLNSLKDTNGNYKYFGDAANGNCLSQIKLK